MSEQKRVFEQKSHEIIKVYRQRIVLILVSVLVLLGFNIDMLVNILSANRVLSLIITTAFLVGILLCCRNFYRLQCDFKVLCDLDHLLMVTRSTLALRQYSGKTYLTSELYERLETSIEFDDDGNMTSGLKPAAARSLIDMVKNAVVERRTLIGYFSSLLVYLGLLGTFIGLFATVGSITGIIGLLSAGLSGEDDLTKMLVMLIQQLEKPLSGMSIAFGTSLAGLCGSIVISALAMNVNRASALFAKMYSDWLIEFVLARNDQGAPNTANRSNAELFAALAPGEIDRRLEQLVLSNEQQLSFIESLTDVLEKQAKVLQSQGEQLIQLSQKVVDNQLEQQQQLSQQWDRQHAYQSQATTMQDDSLELQRQLQAQSEEGNRALVAIADQLNQLPDTLGAFTADQVQQATKALEQSLSQRIFGFLKRYLRRLFRINRQHRQQQVASLSREIRSSEQAINETTEKQLAEQMKSIQGKQATVIMKLFRSIHRLYRRTLNR